MKYRPLFIWPVIDSKMWSWGAQMLMHCNARSYALNKGRMVRISNYSRDALIDLLAEEDIQLDGRAQGTLQLFRTEKQVKNSKADQDVPAEHDSPYEVLDHDGCIAVEPGLAHVASKFVGGHDWCMLASRAIGTRDRSAIAPRQERARDGGAATDEL